VQLLLIRNLHLVDENTVRRRGAVAIELNCVGELVIHGAGEKRSVRNIHRHPHAIHSKRIMQHGVSDGVIVVFGHNVVPGSRSEARNSKSGGVPAFQAVVENAPLVARIQSLPAKVVNPSVQNLLAFKLNALRQVFRARRDIEIKFVRESANLRSYRRVLLVEVSVGVRDAGCNAELCGRAVLTGCGDAQRV
jgi:hypothetical protein